MHSPLLDVSNPLCMHPFAGLDFSQLQAIPPAPVDWGATLTGRRLVHQEEETDGLHADVLSFSAGLYNRRASLVHTCEHVCLSSKEEEEAGPHALQSGTPDDAHGRDDASLDQPGHRCTVACSGEAYRYQNCGFLKRSSVLLNDGGNMS